MDTKPFDERIRSAAQTLSKSHRRIAEYVTAPDSTPGLLTAATIADAVGVSEATVVRFAQALGYKGYPDMQRSMQRALVRDVTTVRRFEATLKDLGPAESVVERCLFEDAQALSATAKTLDAAQVTSAAEAMLKAGHIFVVGHLMAYPAAHLLWIGCRMIGLPATLVESSGADTALHLHEATEDDVLISVSMHRYNAGTVSVVEMAQEIGMGRVAITDDVLSPTAVRSNLALVTAQSGETFFQSTAPVISVVDALLTVCSVMRPERSQSSLARLEENWDRAGTFYHSG
ncbi:MurR/RpiR family transcriptional regulator [Pseudarthrobacter sp. YS3]|uniref:MurR/RpiR family transcriptional regulator n=1 Tax=Pseudarthrobacter sp. YS3 TaxID=3453718 RepID=UPI003EEEFEAF